MKLVARHSPAPNRSSGDDRPGLGDWVSVSVGVALSWTLVASEGRRLQARLAEGELDDLGATQRRFHGVVPAQDTPRATTQAVGGRYDTYSITFSREQEP